MSIPRRIHQMWLSQSEAYNLGPPSKYKYEEYIQSWKDQHPDFIYTFWNMDRALTLVKKYDLLPFFNRIRQHIERCDFLRYLILYEYGGIYVDLDYKCQKSLLPLLQDREKAFVAEPIEHAGPNFYSNSFMMAAPKSSFMQGLLAYIQKHYHPQKNVLENTGPRALSNYIKEIGLRENEILPTPLIIPYNEKQQLAPNWNLADSYCYTKWKEGTNWAQSLTPINRVDIDFWQVLLGIFLLGVVVFLLTLNVLFFVAILLILVGLLLIRPSVNVESTVIEGCFLPPTLKAELPNSNNLIPSVIYQTNEELYLPKGLHGAISSWRQMNADYDHVYYTGEDARNFIRDNFEPRYLKAYDSLIPGAYKADFWRYCILYKRGGVYADSAMVALVPLREFLHPKDKFVSVIDWGYDGGLYNAFIACTPHHPIIEKALKLALERIEKRQLGPNPLWPTGPYALGEALNSYWEQKSGAAFKEGSHNQIRLLTHLAYPEKKMGYVKYGDRNLILTKYPEASAERKQWSKKPHYGDLWKSGRVYNEA